MALKTSHRVWTSLVLGGLSTGIPMAGTAQTMLPQTALSPQLPSTQAILVQAESGEAGEAGLALVADPNSAYAIRLALVDAHLRAALEADRAGLIGEALGLAGHPEAEVMADLRPELESRGVADFSDAMDAYADMIANDAPDADVAAAYDAIAATIATAMRAGGSSDRAVYDALHALVKGAAIEYETVTATGGEPDPIAALEALGFLSVAGDMARQLANGDHDIVAAAGNKAQQFLAGAASLIEASTTPDPSILYAAAAQVELAGLRIE